METLKVAYIDFWPEWYQNENFITPILKERYNVVEDKNNPDVVFHSIFNRMQETKKYHNKKRILVLAENWRPGQIGAHYSISFDSKTNNNFRLPLWQIYWLLWPNLIDELTNKRLRHKDFENFAAFVVSNPSNAVRNNYYDRLSSYKKVDSYGKVRRTSFALDRYSKGKYWRDAKIDFFRNNPHKFMFSMENSSYPWYCTEKLMDAFLVGSVPLYWGDPKVSEDWNEDAFINTMKKGNWLDLVKNADQNQTFWEDIYNEPVFTEHQIHKHLFNLELFKSWLFKIVN